MGQMIFSHMGRIMSACRRGDVLRVGKCAIPTYLTNWQDAFNFILMLVLCAIMCSEPILHCLSNEDVDMFATVCPEIKNISETYYALNMVAMILYYTLLLDLAVFNNRVSAYVLVCGRMLVEIALFLLAMMSVLLMLSSALSCLKQSDKAFKTIPAGFQSLWEMMLGMFSTDHYKSLHDEPVVLCGVYFFLVVSCVFLINLLIAQLCCSYDAIYIDMVGYARLKRSRIIVETMPSVSAKRWALFKEGLGFETRIEFNEGDVGVAGGIQMQEPAGANPTTIDTIKRVGGTTSALAQWPEEAGDAEDDKFGKLETMIKKAMDTMTAAKTTKKKKGGMASSGGGEGSGAEMEGSAGGEVAEGEVEE